MRSASNVDFATNDGIEWIHVAQRLQCVLNSKQRPGQSSEGGIHIFLEDQILDRAANQRLNRARGGRGQRRARLFVASHGPLHVGHTKDWTPDLGKQGRESVQAGTVTLQGKARVTAQCGSRGGIRIHGERTHHACSLRSNERRPFAVCLLGFKKEPTDNNSDTVKSSSTAIQ